MRLGVSPLFFDVSRHVNLVMSVEAAYDHEVLSLVFV